MPNWLEKKFGRFAIQNLTAYLIGGQALAFLVGVSQPDLLELMALVPYRVLQGEVWRLFTFPFMAPFVDPTSASYSVSVIFFAIEMYLLWIFGTALENHWGAFGYNLFLLVGFIATAGAAFIPLWVDLGNAAIPANNGFVYTTVFLAFAFLYPNFTMYLFFILPVKIKWLALISWAMYGFAFLTGGSMAKVLVLASITNFLLFFGKDLLLMARRSHRQMKRQSAAVAEEEAFHRCTICDSTEKTDPALEFRYCPQCTNTPCYCLDHLNDHQHK